MRRRTDLAQLRQIAAVRDLQRVAAQGEASRAAAALRGKEEALHDGRDRSLSLEQGWEAALRAPSVAIEAVPLWASALLRQEGAVRDALRDAQDATTECERRAAGFHAACMRSDLAQDLMREAIRDRIARRDEAALQQAADSHLQRGAGA